MLAIVTIYFLESPSLISRFKRLVESIIIDHTMREILTHESQPSTTERNISAAKTRVLVPLAYAYVSHETILDSLSADR
jgi:hypothetical protein